jgi:hypothetical protein
MIFSVPSVQMYYLVLADDLLPSTAYVRQLSRVRQIPSCLGVAYLSDQSLSSNSWSHVVTFTTVDLARTVDVENLKIVFIVSPEIYDLDLFCIRLTGLWSRFKVLTATVGVGNGAA